MEKVVKVVDEKRGICQVTIADSRWYGMLETDPSTKLPVYTWVPSVTWVASFFPKGIGFMKWLASTGWDEAQAIKEAAGGRGSKVHQAVTALLDGLTISMSDVLPNPETQKPEPLSLEEYEAIISFVAWHKQSNPVLVVRDMVVWNKEHGYAGTADALFLIGRVLWLIDFKTSKAVWPSHRIQVSAYRHTPEVEAVMRNQKVSEIRLGILQLGYRLNKMGWKLTEVLDEFYLFLACHRIWEAETRGQSPLRKDYPMSVALLEQPPKPKAEQEAHAVATENKGGTDGSGTVGLDSEKQQVAHP